MNPPQSSRTPRGRWAFRIAWLVLVLIVALYVVLRSVGLAPRGGSQSPRRRVVVYCAHDSVYADSILRDFQKRSGITVAVKYDTEATKSLGLVELLMGEKDNPRCDLFWNNELLGTMDLKDKGALEPYMGPGYERIPPEFKDPDGCWAGFGARMRVWILNTNKMPAAETPHRDTEGTEKNNGAGPTGGDSEQQRQLALDALMLGEAEGSLLDRVAVAKPLYGTTLTHYCVLWELWGAEKLKAWHKEARVRGLVEATGNAHVKNLVAGGVCDAGWTDSDDFFVAKDDGKPVAVAPVRVDGKVICIPNTVSIIKGARRRSEAHALADYLLSAECEVALANSSSRQIPLGPVDEAAIPQEVQELKAWAREAVPLGSLGPVRAACMEWLKEEYLR